jgi:uncharacterized protein YecA (UPF0149 family)
MAGYYVDPPIPLTESNPEGAALLAELCQERGRQINEAEEQGKPLPQFKEIFFKSHKIRRNDPCPCGSEKKFKKCCGK